MPIIVNNSVRKLNGSSLRDHMKIHSRQELAHGPFHFFCTSPTSPPPLTRHPGKEATGSTILTAVPLELGRAR